MIFHIYISGPCCILTFTGWSDDLPFLETLLNAVLSTLTCLWLERCQEMFSCVNAIIHNIISRPNPFTKNAYYRNSCSCYTHDLQTPSQYNAQPWTINNHSTSARWIWVAYSDIISSKCGRIIVSLSRVTAVFSRAVFVLQLAFLRDWSKHRLGSYVLPLGNVAFKNSSFTAASWFEYRKVISFTLQRCMIGLKYSRPFLIQSKVKPKPITTRSHTFPALRVSYMCLPRVLIGSLDFLGLLWLARVVTFVLVLRHSVENRCMHYLYLQTLPMMPQKM